MGADEDEPKYHLEVSVVDPISYSSPYRPSHSSFCIRIKTNHPAFSRQYSEVRRRYSEFKWLRRIIQRHHPESVVPSLPSGGFLTWNRFNPDFLESRRAGLQTFINELIDVPVYLGERVLHLFMQTELTTKEIELNLLGKRDDEVCCEIEDDPVSCCSSPCDIEPSSVLNASYGEDALKILLDDGYCSADKENVTFINPIESLSEGITLNDSNWYLTEDAVSGETEPVKVNSGE